MGFRKILLLIPIFFLFGGFAGGTLYAQTVNADSLVKARQHVLDSTRAAQKRILDSTRAAQKQALDSAREARQHILDSTRAAQQRAMDSMRTERMRALDSMKAARQQVSDSLAKIREYRQSNRYKDSVAAIRQHRLDSIKADRVAYLDSVKAERKRVLDSTMAVRKAALDSMRAIQQRRMDSLAIIREYRQSDRYKDSVAVVRQERLDSMKAVRQAFNDSMRTERERRNDSMMAARQQYLDSVKAERTAFMDSIKAVRKVRTDSLAKIREKQQMLREIRKKKREEKMQLALELKIKKKREAWSNEKMLKKRWSLPRKVIQNTFTRYNYYFNADKKMDEALDNMLRVRRENYDSLLALYPFDPDRDSAMLAPDMDSIIQKASLGIQIHDPRTKWGDDLYLLLGQAYYYKGDYENAADAFRYVVSLREKRKKKNDRDRRRNSKEAPSIAEEDDGGFLDFLKHESVHNEAILWLARTYTEAHKTGEAESVIDLLETDPKLPEDLKGRLALEKAYIQLDRGNHEKASEQLTIVSADSKIPDWIRMRAAYLNGQLLQEQGKYDASVEQYRQAIDLHPKIDMDFYARKHMAYSQMLSGGEQEEAIAALKKVLKDGKYAPYYEQVYYVLGRLAANSKKNDEALEYMQKSIASPKSTPKQKALSFATMGNIYYDLGSYNEAKIAYDSAALLASAVMPGDSIVTVAIRRSQVLTDITKPYNLIIEQDSLLAMAAMSEKEQESIVRRYIKELERRRQDSIFAAQNAGLNAAIQNTNMANPNSTASNYQNWYFSNPVLMQKGVNEFRRKWGNRPLTDNWRRAGAISGFATRSNSTASDEGDAIPEGIDENGLPTEEALLAYIPKTPEQQAKARKDIRRAYVDMANAYMRQLEDYKKATAALDTLDARYPGHEHKAEELYLRYLMALRQNNLQQAQLYSQQLQQQYSGTKWAELVKPNEDGSGMLTASVPLTTYYDNTYKLLIQRQYLTVINRVGEAYKRYNDPVYTERFNIIEASAHAGAGHYDKADSLLAVFMSKKTSDTLRSWAETVREYINKNRPPKDTTGQVAGGQVAGTATGDSTPAGSVVPVASGDTVGLAATPAIAPDKYSYNAGNKHYVVIAFPQMEARAMGMKAAVGDFNTFKFSSLGLKTDIEMLRPDQGLVVTRTFQNASQAKIYFNMLRSTSQIFREYKPGDYQLFMIEENNYKKLLKDRDIQPYLNFYRASYR